MAKRNVSRTRKTGGGIGPLFGIMCGIVVAVIIVAFVVAGSDTKETPTPDRQPTMDPYQSRPATKKTDWPEVEPWEGVRVGQDRQEIITRFGQPNVREVRSYRGYEILSYYDNPVLAGIFGDAGGVRLTIYVDTDTKKVVYFTPPRRAEDVIREHQEQQQNRLQN